MPDTAVLFSGGLDSAVLVAERAAHGTVHPLYVSVGLAWEAPERAAATQLLRMPVYAGAVRPLAALEFTVRDLYGPSHWAVVGRPPAYDTPDEDVYLVGRNLVLLTKAGVYCAQHGIPRIALGPLAGNPFPDARPAFLTAMAEALSLGLDRPIAIDTPFATLHKEDVIRLGVSLGVPLAMTLSCMEPIDGMHCGRCSKCRERIEAFRNAHVVDDTRYGAARSAG